MTKKKETKWKTEKQNKKKDLYHQLSKQQVRR